MSWASDVFGFEAFNLKDMWRKIKKHPGQLLTGVDPISTKAWNKVLGKNYEPIVDQMGGAYGGHTISAFGQNDGGVYKRAEEAGIDTKAGGQMQDLAHVVAAFYGGAGAANGLGNAFGGLGGGTGTDLGVFSNGGKAGMGSVGQGNAGALANSGVLEGGAAGAAPSSASATSGTNWQDMAQQGLGGDQEQQKQTPYVGRAAEIERQRLAKEEAEKARRLMAAQAIQQAGMYSPAA